MLAWMITGGKKTLLWKKALLNDCIVVHSAPKGIGILGVYKRNDEMWALLSLESIQTACFRRFCNNFSSMTLLLMFEDGTCSY